MRNRTNGLSVKQSVVCRRKHSAMPRMKIVSTYCDSVKKLGVAEYPQRFAEDDIDLDVLPAAFLSQQVHC
jgi:hypothetical protein